LSPVLVFVHGAGATGEVWQSQLLDFPGGVAVDLPGHPHGRVLPRVEAYADWLVKSVRERGFDRPVLVGHSMGGAVALWAALQAPQAFGALVLVGTGPRLRVNPRFLRGLVESPQATLDRFVELCFGPSASEESKARALQAARLLGPDLLRRDLEACDAFDAAGRLHELRLPTLVVCGERDVMTPPALSVELHAGIRGSTLVVVPDAGHMVFLERRRLFRDSLRTFLAQEGPRGW
jgi:pimeloyl-ACP methyl ester carboxylesterase